MADIRHAGEKVGAMTRAEIFGLIEHERQAQQALWSQQRDDGHSVSDWVALLTRHAGLATNDGISPADEVRFRRQRIRCAAVAVAALEAMERKADRPAGAPDAGRGKGY